MSHVSFTGVCYLRMTAVTIDFTLTATETIMKGLNMYIDFLK